MKVEGISICNSPEILDASESSESVSRARAILPSLPKALVRTGNSLPRTFSNSRAFPPPGLLDIRSVISVISSSAETWPFILRSSPLLSNRSMNSCRSR